MRVTVHDVAPRLPSIAELRDHCRSLAMLDAILSPEWETRYHSFDAAWDTGEEMASVRNGSGDEYAIVFSAAGAFVRGFDHESPLSPYGSEDHEPWPGVLDEVPDVFRPYVEEPAFCDEEGVPVATVCLWREAGDDAWRHGPVELPQDREDADGAAYLFELLTDRSPEAFRAFAEEYYGVPVDLDAVRHVQALRPLTARVVATLNPEVTLDELAEDIAGIGYPLSAG
ncbi:hypothetical protein [Actinacidiphila sp. bgisy167]|uniref:hypothetical protein n=1 Tax=Actinacidiphila sp. bgisy167 TaxID=3413797 RepID=UPI003D71C48C